MPSPPSGFFSGYFSGNRLDCHNPSDEEHLDENVLKHAREDYVSVLDTQTVGEALAHLQRSKPTGRIVYIYVLDEENRLRGVLPTRRLLLNPAETPIVEIMVPDVITIPETATLLNACEAFILHRLLAFPIVAADGKLRGIVDVELYTDEISELAHRHEGEDVFQLIGVRLAQVQRASLPTVFGRRFPWLLCNIGGGVACALLAGVFEDVLDRVVALSLFIPVVLAIAESVSIQALSLTLQAHHGNRFRWMELFSALRREAPVGAMLGIACGTLVASVALVWQREWGVAGAILLGISCSVTTAALLGLIVPTLLYAANRDPKLASGPIVLTLTDLATLGYYFSFAYWLV